MSRDQAEAYTPWSGREVCISITDPVDPRYGVSEKRPADLSVGFEGILRLQFHDIDDTLFNPDLSEEAERELRDLFMDEDEALQIAEFVRKARTLGIDTIIIHCEAGVSRSVGVARAISEWMGANPPSSYAMHGRGNEYVRRLVGEALEARQAKPRGRG